MENKWKGKKTKLFIMGGRTREYKKGGLCHLWKEKVKKKKPLVDSLAAEQHSFEAPSAAYFHTYNSHMYIGYVYGVSFFFI